VDIGVTNNGCGLISAPTMSSKNVDRQAHQKAIVDALRYLGEHEVVPEIRSNQIDINKFIENLKKIVKIKCKNTLM